MKKFVVFFTLAVMIAICAYSNNPSTLEESNYSNSGDSITVRVITPEFFIHNTDTVKNGDALWNYSIYEFGTGVRWSEWVMMNRILQEPGRVWRDSETGRWIALIKVGEVLLNPQPVSFQFNYRETTIYSKIEVPVKNYDYLWLMIPFLLFLLLFIILLIISNNLKTKAADDLRQENSMKDQNYRELENKLTEVTNKLPIVAPEIMDSNDLENLHPVGEPIDSRLVGNLLENRVSRALGETPDLIIQARVSTLPENVVMDFSHQRKAITGLKDVVVYIGWNWKDNAWSEVGMVAGACSNIFQGNPENVKKGVVFTKMSLVDENRHPVIYKRENIPQGIKYPKMICDLILQYHRNNIDDISRTDARVVLPKK